MTRKECLDRAAECVLQDRASEYGGMEDNFGRIANFWSVYLGRKVCPVDVAMMMALLKVARIRSNKAHADSFVDLAGYAACGADLAPAGRAEGCEELVQEQYDAPQTKEELYSKILESNPATYGHPHKPTGEELAELAREEL